MLACGSFVVTSSKRKAVRAVLSGQTARSTVRRHPIQSSFLRQVGSQIRIVRLQGFFFFGTSSAAEASIRSLLEAAQWQQMPIRFLVLDFSGCSGIDFSAAESLLRLHRHLCQNLCLPLPSRSTSFPCSASLLI